MSQSSFNDSIAYATYVPLVDATYDLGTSLKRFRDLYLSGDIKTSGNIIGQDNGTSIYFSTVDGADTALLSLNAGGAIRDKTRSAYIDIAGNEHTLNGQVQIFGGNTDIGSGAGDIDLHCTNTVGGVTMFTQDLARFAVGADGDFKSNATNGGNFVIQRAGYGYQVSSGTLDATITGAFGSFPALLIVSSQNSFDGIVNGSYGANASGASFKGFKTRSASSSAPATSIVLVGDTLLSLGGYGADGAAYKIGASISYVVDSAGTPALNSIPTQIKFSVVAPSGTSQDVRMTLTSPGTFFIAKNVSQLDSDITGVWGSGGYIPLVIQTNNSTNDGIVLVTTGANTAGFNLYGAKTRSNSGDANTAVSSGDSLFNIAAYLADGADYRIAGSIIFKADGAPVAGTSSPGRIELSTTPSGSTSQLLRWTLTSSGNFASDATSGGSIILQSSGAVINYNSAGGTFQVGCSTSRDFALYTNNTARFTLDGSTGDLKGDATNGGHIVLNQLGKTLKIKEGSNAKMGQSVLVGGTVTVSTTAVTANSRIQLTTGVAGGVLGILSVGTIVGGTSFVINSSSAADTSTINWLIFEPA